MFPWLTSTQLLTSFPIYFRDEKWEERGEFCRWVATSCGGTSQGKWHNLSFDIIFYIDQVSANDSWAYVTKFQGDSYCLWQSVEAWGAYRLLCHLPAIGHAPAPLATFFLPNSLSLRSHRLHMAISWSFSSPLNCHFLREDFAGHSISVGLASLPIISPLFLP